MSESGNLTQAPAAYAALESSTDAEIEHRPLALERRRSCSSCTSTTANSDDNDLVETTMVVCPFLFEELDAMLTRPDGAPTIYFHAVVATSVAMGLAMLTGTFCTPGLLHAWEASDPLLALGLVFFGIVCTVLLPLVLGDMRGTIHGATDGGLLLRLGAGNALIPTDKEKT
eukprot:COSAG02_NODE_22559_length_748_cov_1.084746_1_plen_170_part_01